MNEACRYWHAVYSATGIVIWMGTTAIMGIIVSMPTMTQTMLAYRNFILEAPMKPTRKLN